MRIFRHWNIWVTSGGIFIAIIIVISAFLLLRFSPFQLAEIQNTPVLGMTIVPAKTFTPTAILQFEQPTATPTMPLVGGIRAGMYVQILGTGGSGLRIRDAAGLSSNVKFYGLDDEVFLVKDGPVEQDGYTWWLLVAPYDETRNGWAASNFLGIVEQQP